MAGEGFVRSGPAAGGDGEPVRVSGMDQIARVDLAETDAAADGSGYFRVGEIEFRVINGGLGSSNGSAIGFD